MRNTIATLPDSDILEYVRVILNRIMLSNTLFMSLHQYIKLQVLKLQKIYLKTPDNGHLSLKEQVFFMLNRILMKLLILWQRDDHQINCSTLDVYIFQPCKCSISISYSF